MSARTLIGCPQIATTRLFSLGCSEDARGIPFLIPAIRYRVPTGLPIDRRTIQTPLELLSQILPLPRPKAPPNCYLSFFLFFFSFFLCPSSQFPSPSSHKKNVSTCGSSPCVESVHFFCGDFCSAKVTTRLVIVK